MDRPAIEAVLAELHKQQSAPHGPDREKAIDVSLSKLEGLAPPQIHHTVGSVRQYIHRSSELKMVINITPSAINVVSRWQ